MITHDLESLSLDELKNHIKEAKNLYKKKHKDSLKDVISKPYYKKSGSLSHQIYWYKDNIYYVTRQGKSRYWAIYNAIPGKKVDFIKGDICYEKYLNSPNAFDSIRFGNLTN